MQEPESGTSNEGGRGAATETESGGINLRLAYVLCY